MFSSRLTSVTFLADPSAGGGLPRGTFIYATCPVPIQVGTWQSNVNCLHLGLQRTDTAACQQYSLCISLSGPFLLLGDRNRLLWRL